MESIPITRPPDRWVWADGYSRRALMTAEKKCLRALSCSPFISWSGAMLSFQQRPRATGETFLKIAFTLLLFSSAL